MAFNGKEDIRTNPVRQSIEGRHSDEQKVRRSSEKEEQRFCPDHDQGRRAEESSSLFFYFSQHFSSY